MRGESVDPEPSPWLAGLGYALLIDDEAIGLRGPIDFGFTPNLPTLNFWPRIRPPGILPPAV